DDASACGSSCTAQTGSSQEEAIRQKETGQKSSQESGKEESREEGQEETRQESCKDKGSQQEPGEESKGKEAPLRLIGKRGSASLPALLSRLLLSVHGL